MKKSMLFVIVCSLFCMGTFVCEAGVIQDIINRKMCERNDRNYLPSQMLLIQSTVDAFVNNSWILNLSHNTSVYRILFLYYLFTTMGGNNPLSNFIRRVLNQFQIFLQEFFDKKTFNNKITESYWSS